MPDTASLVESLNMMGSVFIRWLVAGCFAVVMVTGCSQRADTVNNTDALLNAESDALEAMTLLTELRAGRVTNVIELLEMEVDSSILLIHGELSQATESERQSALETLDLLKKYRASHLRRREAIIPDTESFADYTSNMMHTASNILNDLN